MTDEQWIASLEKDIAFWEEQQAIKPLAKDAEKLLEELRDELDFVRHKQRVNALMEGRSK